MARIIGSISAIICSAVRSGVNRLIFFFFARSLAWSKSGFLVSPLYFIQEDVIRFLEYSAATEVIMLESSPPLNAVPNFTSSGIIILTAVSTSFFKEVMRIFWGRVVFLLGSGTSQYSFIFNRFFSKTAYVPGLSARIPLKK